MVAVEPLLHSELIAPGRKYGDRILLPGEIPLHPAVFNSDLVYTLEFVKQVYYAIPESVEKDVFEIEKALGTKTGIKVTEGISIADALDGLAFNMLDHRPNPLRKCVDIIYGQANIAMDVEDKAVRHLFDQHPMGRLKQESYAFSNDGGRLEHLVWYVHNIHDGRLPMDLYFRNFAILFNNLGLEQLA